MDKVLKYGGLPPTDLKKVNLERWTKFNRRKNSNRAQQTHIWRSAKSEKDMEAIRIAIRASSSLTFCNKRVICERAGLLMNPVAGWNCGKKYCAYCSNKKRVKILNRFVDFFDSEQGKEMLKKYDLGLFTVTLQHGKGKRIEPYYGELSKHFRNALKYGSFKKFIAGGFYNTEHTFTKNGHHIHRHAMVLIPKQYNLPENWEMITNELRTQWCSRTGGSFHIDLVPLGYDRTTETTPTPAQIERNIGEYMLEVTKYITKRNDDGIIQWQIVKAIEQNNRAKFYGRFGILHRIKQLNINLEQLDDQPKQVRNLVVVTPEFKTVNKEWKPQKTTIQKIKIRVPEHKYIDGKKEVVAYRDKITIRKHRHRVNRKYKIVVNVKFNDVVPIADTAEAFNEFKTNIRSSAWEYQLRKWDKFTHGEFVGKWKDTRNALQRFREKFVN